MLDTILLVVIVVQGFAVWWYEWQVWKIHAERANERAEWRAQKRKQQLSKAGKPVEPTNTVLP